MAADRPDGVVRSTNVTRKGRSVILTVWHDAGYPVELHLSPEAALVLAGELTKQARKLITEALRGA